MGKEQAPLAVRVAGAKLLEAVVEVQGHRGPRFELEDGAELDRAVSAVLASESSMPRLHDAARACAEGLGATMGRTRRQFCEALLAYEAALKEHASPEEKARSKMLDDMIRIVTRASKEPACAAPAENEQVEKGNSDDE